MVKPDVASSLDGKYFKIGKAGQSTFSHYVWLDIGAAADPAPVGLTAVPVVVAANASAPTIATAVAAAIDALADFKATASGAEVIVTCAIVGESAGAADGLLTAGTGFSFTQCQLGGALDLGALDGNVEPGFSETLLEVLSHQTGVTPIASLRQGIKSSLSITMKEASVAKLREIMGKVAGGFDTPVSGTEVFGWGTSRQGLNTLINSRRLVMHPVVALSTDKSKDLCFWKAYPQPKSLVYSGEAPKTLAVDWIFYLDNAKPKAISLFAFGDWTQYVP
jgi:hypothetical protein